MSLPALGTLYVLKLLLKTINKGKCAALRLHSNPESCVSTVTSPCVSSSNTDTCWERSNSGLI